MTYSEVEKEIDQVQQRWMDAVKRQNAATFDRIIADDFVIASDAMAERLAGRERPA